MVPSGSKGWWWEGEMNSSKAMNMEQLVMMKMSSRYLNLGVGNHIVVVVVVMEVMVV